MSLIRRMLGSMGSEEARRGEAEKAIQRAQGQVEQGQHESAIKSLTRALDLLDELKGVQDQERRGLCHIRLAEATLFLERRPTYPPLSSHTARKILDQLDEAESEIEPLLRPSSLSNSHDLSYVQRNPGYPRGLIAMYRGAAFHFSSRGNAPERRQAISYYEQASQLLDPKSDDGVQARELLADAQATTELRGHHFPESGTYQLPALLNEPIRMIGPGGNPVGIVDESRPAVILSTSNSNTPFEPPPEVTNLEEIMPDRIIQMETPEFVAGWAQADLSARTKRPDSEGWIRAIARGTVNVSIQGQAFTLEAWGVRGAVSDAVLQYHVDASGLPGWIVAHLDEKYDYDAAHEAWMAKSYEEGSDSQEDSAMSWPHQDDGYHEVDIWNQDQFDSMMDSAVELEIREDLLGALHRYEEILNYALGGKRLPSAMLVLNRMGLVHLDLENPYEALGRFQVSIEYGDRVEEFFEHALEDDTEFGSEVRATASERVRYLRTLQAMAHVGSARANLALGNSEVGYRLAEKGGDLAEQAGDEEWQKQAYRLMIGTMLLGPDFRG